MTSSKNHICLCLLLALLPSLADADDSHKATADDCLKSGLTAFAMGAIDEAVAQWTQAEQLYAHDKNLKGRTDALINLGAAYQALGQTCLATRALEEAVRTAEAANDPVSVMAAHNTLGAAYMLANRAEEAEGELRVAQALARVDHDTCAEAMILNNLGGTLAEQGLEDDGLRTFQECVALALQTTNQLLAAKAQCNAAAAAARAGRYTDAERLNGEATKLVQALGSTHDQAMLFLRVGQTDWRISRRLAGSEQRLQQRAAESYEHALQVAESISDLRVKTYALGYLGQNHEGKREYAGALELTREAIFVAQKVQSPDALYRWEWQTGRILNAQADAAGATAAYRRSLNTLQGIRRDVSLAYATPRGPFREEIGPVFFELADLLLRQARTMKDPREQERTLLEARDTVEQMKSVELEDYFQDPCANLMRAKARQIERVDPRTAVIYIVPLADRIELLVGLSTGLREFTVPVTSEQLTSAVRDFRLNLEKRTTRQYLTQGKQIHDWLIAPIAGMLADQKIETLVFVPDGALRTIPMAALYDGQHFLIERYAVAVAPGLTLIEPKPIERTHVHALAAGLSQPSRGFPALPYVPDELKNVSGVFHGPQLLDKDFQVGVLQKKLAEGQWGIVHVASHGEFNRDVSKSFILASDGKITLDQIEDMIRPGQYRGRPVELLTLSACQTAAGDDRAALGLAGVAVKSGARSALASLWFVNDQSTGQLISSFYTALSRDTHISKARALQLAQIRLIQEPRYQHPCYWAPFLIIGNWL